MPGPAPDDFLTRDAVFDALASRAGVLTGVCVTGGEPLIHDGLADLLDAVRGLGLKVKMDTNGMLPERLEAVSVDFIALDLKLAPERYGELGGPPDAPARLAAAIDVLRRSVPAYEFRTTVVPGLVGPRDVAAIASLLGTGARLTLAQFRPGATLDPRIASSPAPDDELIASCVEAAARHGVDCRVRGATTM